MNNSENSLFVAVSYLSCVDCGGNFEIKQDEIVCVECLNNFPIIDGNIFQFKDVAVPRSVVESTMYGPEFEELCDQVPSPSMTTIDGTVALDYGCGSSSQVFRLSCLDQVETVFGVDWDLEPLRIASRVAREKGYENIFFLQYEEDTLPFKDHVFNLVTSNQVLEHVEDPEAVIKVISRKIKPGGKFRVNFPNGNSIAEILRNAFHRLNKTRNPHISQIGYDRAMSCFAKEGFLVEEFHSSFVIKGPLIYFFDGLIFRYLLRKRGLSIKKMLGDGWLFKIIGFIEKPILRWFPKTGHGFSFELIKKVE